MEVNSEEQYKIAQILDSKLDRWFQCPLLYRIQWLGYESTDEEFAWLPATEFSANDFIEDFHRCYPGQTRTTRQSHDLKIHHLTSSLTCNIIGFHRLRPFTAAVHR